MNMTEETRLTVQGDAQHLMPALSVQQATQRYQAMATFIRDIMREGADFGTIPGTNKPTLLKPGAEKLTTFFGLTTRFEIVEKVEDWSGGDHGGEPFFYYWFRASLWRGDRLIAEADGSCNTMESKYRWRWVGAEDIPPGMDAKALKTRGGSLSEFTFAVDKAETGGKYGKPAEYWQRFKDAIDNNTAKQGRRKTAKGAEYDTWEIDSTVYRVPNEDVFSQVNTVQKMAQKRALVAATLLAVNASEFFTQDLEDLDLDNFVDASYTVSPAPTQQNTPNQAEARPAAPKAAPKAKPPATPRAKAASVRCAGWGDAAKALAAEVPYYQKAGQVDFYHLTGAAAKLGHEEINDGNLADVLADLRQYAIDQQAMDDQGPPPSVDEANEGNGEPGDDCPF